MGQKCHVAKLLGLSKSFKVVEIHSFKASFCNYITYSFQLQKQMIQLIFFCDKVHQTIGEEDFNRFSYIYFEHSELPSRQF